MLIGMVGKPNVGKSTFFSAATLIPVPIYNRPFTTIKPNRGIAYVRSKCVCEEMDVQDHPSKSLCMNGIRLIPVELIDCAGLVPDAWKGKGLGNYFLDEIRKADALIHVIDAAGATDEEGKPCPPGTRDPLHDVQFLERELAMWLVQLLMKDWRRLTQSVMTTRKGLEDELSIKLSGLAIKKTAILDAIKVTGLNPSKPTDWSTEDLTVFAKELRRIAKPMMIAANKIDLPPSEQNIHCLKEQGHIVVPCSAEAELILRRASQKKLIHYRPGDPSFHYIKKEEMTPQQVNVLEFIKKILQNWRSTGIQETINTAFFELLQMITVYPVENVEKLSDHTGHVLPDAYLVRDGTSAKEFAYLIHTDLGEGFIYAIDARTRKRLGDDYVLKDRDIIKIVSVKGRK